MYSNVGKGELHVMRLSKWGQQIYIQQRVSRTARPFHAPTPVEVLLCEEKAILVGIGQ